MDIPTDFWVAALLKRIELGGGFGYVTRRGDPKAGTVLIKTLHLREGRHRLLRLVNTGEGERWISPLRSEAPEQMDAYIEKEKRFDPDLWLVEIEDVEGRHFLTEPVEAPEGGSVQDS
ncbi:MAG: DUF1491 family protein [Asticcacaulis sp.]